MANVHVIVLIYPASGKSKRVLDIMQDMAQKVHEQESETRRYLMMTDATEGVSDPTVVMMETYKDRAANEHHLSTVYFKELIRMLKEEELMEKPPTIVRNEAAGGFDLDRVLIKP